MSHNKKKYIEKPPLDQSHWQFNLNFTPAASDSPENAFSEKPGKDRPCTHIKTNASDH